MTAPRLLGLDEGTGEADDDTDFEVEDEAAVGVGTSTDDENGVGVEEEIEDDVLVEDEVEDEEVEDVDVEVYCGKLVVVSILVEDVTLCVEVYSLELVVLEEVWLASWVEDGAIAGADEARDEMALVGLSDSDVRATGEDEDSN